MQHFQCILSNSSERISATWRNGFPILFQIISKLPALKKAFPAQYAGWFSHLHVCVEAMPSQSFSADRLQVYNDEKYRISIFLLPFLWPFFTSPPTNLQKSKEALLMNFIMAFSGTYVLTLPFLLSLPLTSLPLPLNGWMAIPHWEGDHSSQVWMQFKF